ncbi:hypothetical protein LIER_19114 [Lithospermum erythrorhizon]|uniref:Retrovirus-related Pol polyprotein from transposon TNT 1-94-like beta-barrel domain-containing protein n=1 Tax=Lithospermum erythrorhizon TaxID=34254 RepID=A0AAV3QKW1_LITER
MIYLANVLLEKFPSTWNDYRNRLKHKKKDMPLQELISHMRSEKANRLKDKLDYVSQISTNANLVEIGGPYNVNRFKAKGKVVQKKWQSKKPNQKKFKANLVANASDWVLDTGATRHLCANKEIFQNFVKGKCPSKSLKITSNSTTTRITSKGKISLKITFEKTLTLNNVLYVLTLNRNLVLCDLLNKASLKLAFEDEKVVLTRNGEFVGKGYAQNAAAYRFMSLCDHSISEARDAGFFEHVFALKKDVISLVSSVVLVYLHMHASSSTSNIHVDEPRKSKRPRIEKIFGDYFIKNFISEITCVDS